MLTMKQTALLTGAIVTALTTMSVYAAKQTPEEEAVGYRQSAYTMIKHHFGPMAAMVKGEMEFDAEAFTKNAEALATLSAFPINGFIEGSYIGQTDAKTAAKANIGTDMADFKEKMESFKVEAANLAKASASGDMAEIKPQFGKTAQTCKACHDQYREKD